MTRSRLFLALVAALTSACTANAQTEFSLPGSGSASSWFTGGNWTAGVPTAATNSIIGNDTALVDSANAEALSVSMRFGSQITVGAGRTLTISNNLIAGTTDATPFNTSTARLSGAGDIVVNGASGTSTFHMNAGNGLLGGGGLTVGGNSVFSSPDTLIVQRNVTTSGTAAVTGFSGAGALQQTGVTWTNTGTLNRDAAVVWQLNNGTITNSGTWNNTGNGFTNAGGGSATFNNNSLATLNINSSTTFTNVAITNVGTINVAANQSFTVSGGSFNGDNGTINVGSGASVNTGAAIVANSATVMGTGTVANGLTLSGSSSITAGELAAGTLTVNGNFAANDTTVLTVELGALAAGAFTGGVLDVNGGVTLAGTSDIAVNTTAFDATGADIGKQFVFLTADSAITTTFASSSIVSGIYEFDVLYNQGGNNVVLQLTAVPEPSSLAVLGLVAVGGFMRRRRS